MPKKTKPTIIILHGIRGSHYGLLDISAHLEDKYNILAPDIPGTGDTEEIANKNMDSYIEWLRDYIKKHNLKKPYVIGHSMGSMIVSHFVDKYPEDVAQKVVLISPVFRPKFAQKCCNVLYVIARFGLALMGGKLQFRFVTGKFFSYIISHLFTYDRKQQKVIDELYYKHSGHYSSASSFTADLNISMHNQTIIPKGKDVLLCYGKHDQLTLYKYTEKIAKKNGATAKRIDNAGHLLNYETPKLAAEIIRKFLES